MTTKQEFEDDPEGYWELKRDREEQDGRDRLEAWERENPNLPYGYTPPK
jgi:hypothetical protein